MSFKLSNYARGFYGDKDYTIEEGIMNRKGDIVVQNNLSTGFKNQYFYREGLLEMKLNGTEAKSFAKKNNIIIKEG